MSSFGILQMELEEAKQSVELSGWVDRDPQAKDRLALLEQIEHYVESFVWCPKNPYKKELSIYLRSKCSLGRAAQRLGVSEQWLYKLVRQAAVELQSRFSGVFQALQQSNLQILEQEFHKTAGEGPSLLDGLAHRYWPSAHGGVRVASCADELRFLRKLARMDDEVLGLNRKKLEHLLYLLGSDAADRMIREYVSQSVYGTWEVDEALARLGEYENSILISGR